MGVVLEAVHLELDARVAVKILRGDVALSEEASARFLREAKAASLLRSEFVARVTDFGRIGTAPFMVMELLDGVDLEHVLQAGPMPIADAVDAVIQAAAGLAEAHGAGIVHRDIKPSNLFRTQRSDGTTCVKIVDFGISKVVRLPGGEGPASPLRAITGDARVMGTPLYMSPEQVRSARDVDERTDVWSLSAVLYELVTGEPPFLADDVAQLVARVLEQAPVRPEAIRRDVPPELSDVILRGLTKDREARTPSMADLASELAPFGSAEGGIAARRASLPGVRTAPRSLATAAVARTALAETTDAPMPAARFAPSSMASTSSRTDEEEEDRSKRAFAATRPSSPTPQEGFEPSGHGSGAPPVESTKVERAATSRRGAWLVAGALVLGGAGVTVFLVQGGGVPRGAAETERAPSVSAPLVPAAPPTQSPGPDVTPQPTTSTHASSHLEVSAPTPSGPRGPKVAPPSPSALVTSHPATTATVAPTATAVATPTGRSLW